MTTVVPRLTLRHLLQRRSFFSWPGSKSEAGDVPQPEPPKYDFVTPMKAQDPRGRIEFLRPRDVPPGALGTLLSQVLATKSIEGEELEEEIHCVPFWTMLYTTALSGEKMDKSTESRVGPLRIDFGCSVSAVGPDHWAHGIVLTDSAWSLYEERVRALYNKPPLTDEKGDVLLSDWFRNHRIPDANVAPFARGYPVITNETITSPMAKFLAKAAQSAKAEAAGDQASAISPEHWLVKITERIRTYAIPHYRIAYKSSSAKETLYRDGVYCVSPELGSQHYFALSKSAPRIPRGSPEEGSPAKYPFTGMTNRMEYLGETVDDDREMITAMSLCDAPEDIEKLAQDIVKATNRAKLDWNDPNIFSSNLLAPTPNIAQVMRHAAYRCFKFPDPPAVHVLDKVKATSATASVRQPRPAVTPLATKGKATLLPARAQKAQVIMQDPKHYYGLLDIVPDSTFLEAAQDKAITDKLDRSRRIARYLILPQGAGEELVKAAEQYGRVFEQAYEALNSVAKRKAYQRSAQQSRG